MVEKITVLMLKHAENVPIIEINNDTYFNNKKELCKFYGIEEIEIDNKKFRFATSEEIEFVKNHFIENDYGIMLFYLLPNLSGKVLRSSVYELYIEFCNEKNISCQSRNKLYKFLISLGVKEHRQPNGRYLVFDVK
jgi:hypothetical protein